MSLHFAGCKNTTTIDLITRTFEEYGHILKLILVKNDYTMIRNGRLQVSGEFRGYGFVTFAEREFAKNALKEFTKNEFRFNNDRGSVTLRWEDKSKVIQEKKEKRKNKLYLTSSERVDTHPKSSLLEWYKKRNLKIFEFHVDSASNTLALIFLDPRHACRAKTVKPPFPWTIVEKVLDEISILADTTQPTTSG